MRMEGGLIQHSVSHYDAIVKTIDATKDISRLRHFFFHDTPTSRIYTLSLHDALPISHPFDGNSSRQCRGIEADEFGISKLVRVVIELAHFEHDVRLRHAHQVADAKQHEILLADAEIGRAHV